MPRINNLIELTGLTGEKVWFVRHMFSIGHPGIGFSAAGSSPDGCFDGKNTNHSILTEWRLGPTFAKPMWAPYELFRPARLEDYISVFNIQADDYAAQVREPRVIDPHTYFKDERFVGRTAVFTTFEEAEQQQVMIKLFGEPADEPFAGLRTLFAGLSTFKQTLPL